MPRTSCIRSPARASISGLRDVAAMRALLRRGAGTQCRYRRAAAAVALGAQRRSENALAAHAFGGLNRLFSNDASPPTLLRGPLLGLAGRLPPLTHALWRRAAGFEAGRPKREVHVPARCKPTDV